ncbi:hypothetical protein NS334_16695 [Sphingomonas endophytica]|uniref:Uncharacterized protein n=1 Tax=Sphingomonas endophytica TaxID=869719 RepID=A0A147HRW8_9SPHN|nr:hypothetical protein NS334_16695 [Sphingomonas endophytica]
MRRTRQLLQANGNFFIGWRLHVRIVMIPRESVYARLTMVYRDKKDITCHAFSNDHRHLKRTAP